MHRIGREALLEVLARVEPGRSAKNHLEQSACFCFRDGWVMTFNDEICCRTRSELPAEFTGAVSGRHLKEYLENVSDDEVGVEFTETELKIAARRKRAGLRLEADIQLPVDLVEVPDRWTPIDNPEALGRAVKQVCRSAGTKEDEFVTLCVHLTPGYLESTDRFEAVRYEIATGFDEPVMVRAKSLAHIAQLGVTKAGLTPGWAHFRNKALVISMRRQLEKFYDLAPFLEFSGVAVDLPRGADEAARLGKVLTQDDKDSNKVTVILTNGRMTVRGQGAHGWSEVDPECNYRGPEVAFRISPDTLETLVTDHHRCEIDVTGDKKKLKVDGDRWTYVTVLGSADDVAAVSESETSNEVEGGSDDV